MSERGTRGAKLDFFWFRDCEVRQVAFSRATFRDASFEGDTDFGAEPAGGRVVDLTGATALVSTHRTWPAGWTDEQDPDDPDQLRVVSGHSEVDHSTIT